MFIDEYTAYKIICFQSILINGRREGRIKGVKEPLIEIKTPVNRLIMNPE